MNAHWRVAFRIFVCIAFIASLYGGVALVTAALFANGLVILGMISGLVLSVMTATALALFGLAWSLTAFPQADDHAELLSQPG